MNLQWKCTKVWLLAFLLLANNLIISVCVKHLLFCCFKTTPSWIILCLFQLYFKLTFLQDCVPTTQVSRGFWLKLLLMFSQDAINIYTIKHSHAHNDQQDLMKEILLNLSKQKWGFSLCNGSQIHAL